MTLGASGRTASAPASLDELCFARACVVILFLPRPQRLHQFSSHHRCPRTGHAVPHVATSDDSSSRASRLGVGISVASTATACCLLR